VSLPFTATATISKSSSGDCLASRFSLLTSHFSLLSSLVSSRLVSSRLVSSLLSSSHLFSPLLTSHFSLLTSHFSLLSSLLFSSLFFSRSCFHSAVTVASGSDAALNLPCRLLACRCLQCTVSMYELLSRSDCTAPIGERQTM
jgi:hypothetical protein